MTWDLRSFLNHCAGAYPNELKRITRPVRNLYEITALVNHLDRQGRTEVLSFEKVVESPLPLVTNLLADRERCARILGTTSAEVSREYARRVRGQIRPQVVGRAEAPVQAVVRTGQEADLAGLAIPVHHQADRGPYITGGFFTTYDPNSGAVSCAIQIGWVKGPREIGCQWSNNSPSLENLGRYEAQGREMPCAIWVGHHPLAILAGQVRRRHLDNLYATMGSVMGEALRLVPSVTLGDDFLVPADAEFVIEGRVRRSAEPEFTVTAVTHRSEPIWYDIQPGYAEEGMLNGLTLEADLYDFLHGRFPSVQRVHVPRSGCWRHHVYVQVKNPPPGEAREVVAAALTGDAAVKHAVVVEDDVDIFNDREMLWAVATRTQWDQDLMLLPTVRGDTLDPSTPATRRSCKGGLDATRPHGMVFEERNALPKEIRETFRLEDYISAEALAKAPTE